MRSFRSRIHSCPVFTPLLFIPKSETETVASLKNSHRAFRQIAATAVEGGEEAKVLTP